MNGSCDEPKGNDHEECGYEGEPPRESTLHVVYPVLKHRAARNTVPHETPCRIIITMRQRNAHDSKITALAATCHD